MENKPVKDKDSQGSSHDENEEFLENLLQQKKSQNKDNNEESAASPPNEDEQSDEDVLNILDTLSFNDLPPLEIYEKPARKPQKYTSVVVNYNRPDFHKLNIRDRVKTLSYSHRTAEKNMNCLLPPAVNDRDLVLLGTLQTGPSSSATQHDNKASTSNSADVFVSRSGRVTKRKIYTEDYEIQKQIKSEDKDWVKDKTKAVLKRPYNVSNEGSSSREVPTASCSGASPKKKSPVQRQLSNKEIMEKSSLFRNDDTQSPAKPSTSAEGQHGEQSPKAYDTRSPRAHSSSRNENDLIQCPMCYKMWPSDEIQNHAWYCLSQ